MRRHRGGHRFEYNGARVAGRMTTWSAEEAGRMNAVIPSEEQVVEWITSLSNWGRWGDEDQAGCLNLITPEKRQQAAALIRDGATVSCARPITTEITPDITYQVQRYMVDSGEGRDTDPSERRRVRRGAAEFIGMVFRGQTIPQTGALAHFPGREKI